ncbi:hypothetical protein AKJ64_04020 [candidate division MSBL1 archaeon SCGC-AAA259E17]|uniref:Uncharacterized protein n=1 Tax=candidate division MSBL1 archaeon SCGC-AAA259E17 TaxID=1698263 RepID=A0A133UD39_9EURY|nr:hypothetical protein AKJ64_04020 [candidate division MSBL1 archaeon SCGC-AAA259E17]
MEKKKVLKILGCAIAFGLAVGVIGGAVEGFLSNYGPLKNAGKIVTVPLTAVVVGVFGGVVHRQFRNEEWWIFS